MSRDIIGINDMLRNVTKCILGLILACGLIGGYLVFRSLESKNRQQTTHNAKP